jgi:hypothetical protein
VRKTAKLVNGLHRLESGNGAQQASNTFGQWAQMQLESATTKFFGALPHESSSLEMLHQFRIRAKALRYTIELVAPAFSTELRDSAYPIVESLQERLGKVQDLVTARSQFEEWAADDSHALLRSLLAELVQAETDQLEDCVPEFGMWWNEKRIGTLRKILPHPANDTGTEDGEIEAGITEDLQQADPQTQQAS